MILHINIIADIEFSMPLKVKENKSPVTNDSTDTGYESIDVNEDFDDLKDNICDNDDDDDDDETDQWLENMGMGDDIKKLNSSEVIVIAFIEST